MSEQARLLLQEKFDKIINKRKIWTIVAVCAVSAGVGIFEVTYRFDVLTFVTGIVVSAICGTAAIWFIQNYYGKQEDAIVRQIEQMVPVIPRCDNCGKEIPKNASYFCPFCGNPLEANAK